MSGEMPIVQKSAHETVLLSEAVTALQVQPGGIYVDGTFGRGGHSRLILQQLGETGRLIALQSRQQVRLLIHASPSCIADLHSC